MEPGKDVLDCLANFTYDVFPDTRNIDDYKLALATKYELAQPSVAKYNLERNSEIMLWFKQQQPGLLWIDGFCEPTQLDWTTKLSLELVSAAVPAEDIISLSFFCGEVSLADNLSTPRCILQSFITQIMLQNPKCFSNNKICHETEMTKYKFTNAVRSFKGLWALLNGCLNICKSGGVLMILNNIDDLILKDREGQEKIDFEDFIKLVDGLAKASEPLGKVLITSRVPGLFERVFPSNAKAQDHTGRTLVTIPRKERRGK